MGVSQNEGYRLGVPIIRIIMLWGLYWGTTFWENYHIVGRRGQDCRIKLKRKRNGDWDE